MASNVIPLHRPPRAQRSQDEQALHTFALARVDCPDCPATAGNPCVRLDHADGWRETRILHPRRVLAAKQLITSEAIR
ncbi:hypothetical protein ACFVMC_00420 [Nocardia sp. NPDC127579]|uniref:zinc finger domain-containing protein n=1 Tax=Nocardia sp. NPDC127579 TaxID=3345402 RepID=UPI003624E8CE